MKKPFALMAASAVAAAGFALPALAASYATDGTAAIDDGQLSISSTDTTAGSVDFSSLDGASFSSLTTLSADYNVTDDDCGGGSPRFSIGLDDDADGVTDGYVHVYVGPYPNYVGCAQNTWVNTGNLVDSTDARYDLTQFGGAFYATHADAVALLGDATITDILLVTDGGWMPADHEQTVLFDNVTINGQTETFAKAPDPADACKDGGWKTMSNPSFKNQGQCIKHFKHQ